ncbi:bifunctional tetrahydrofolate synthase/dihydrofolate synthase [Sulfuritalea hydrogenivorans]|jgi:dihydrofolate synthase/folylpolyglutamate synthase|uniref:Dihydrofolate synthase/folylpolyglutamate synthase n=1 Tax=Sulfuritalea hydrogenivorans sk43H TaxID=1223802 RepID=W0SDT7_9PROT|nr:bifunctional tetrahydrofolate synthase/dihydrofolate synthase [Sulfuritalea hydrogenivorans]BAO29107.1 bifunctional folylpolyglutamate synthase/dihydrofolate synthase [Sulfuritalea hydrogenivorans sk43H]
MPFSAPGLPDTGLDGWLAHLEALHPRGSAGIELGLERVAAVKSRLGQRETCPVILVGGTNGKGSTCAMLERILLAAGYRVGLYTSPHLLHYNERVRINAVAADDASLCDAFVRVEQARGDAALTYFEFGTLAAWEVFAAAGLDAVILEVGLGGRLDATNVYEPACAIVTGIDLDHMDFLGDDREAIGREKAGIFRAGVPAICGDPKPPQSLLSHAGAVGARLQVMGRDFGYQRQEQQWLYWSRPADAAEIRRGGLAFPALRGDQQLANAACALAALDALHHRLPVAMKDIRQGLIEVELAGRFQVLPGRPAVVLDVAHNPQAARVLAANLGNMGFHRNTWAVFGMLADKDIDGVIDALGERVTHWLPCTLEGRRAASADSLASLLRARGMTVQEEFESPATALLYAQENAGEDDRILAFGSFLTVAAAMQLLGRPA